MPPMDVPSDDGAATVEALSRYAAVKLFVDRAVAVMPDFALTADNAPAVAAITTLVDGLPLAIELAAARTKMLTPQAMLTRLQTRLGELGGGARDLPERQQTLRGAIAWSYDLLDEGTRKLFAQFAVFIRGASLEQLQTVCRLPDDAHGDILDGLSTLVDHNLLRPVANEHEPRFSMLHVIREFALERLGESPDARNVHQRHAEAFLQLAEIAAPQLTGAHQKDWLDRLEMEHDNSRAALEWAISEGREALAARLLAAHWRFWQMRGHLSQGRQLAEEVLALPNLQHHTVERFAALEAAGGIAYWQGDNDAAQRVYDEAVAIAREGVDKAMLAEAVYNAAYPLLVSRADLTRATELLVEATELFRERGDQAGIAKAVAGTATVFLTADPPNASAAIPALKEARDRFRKMDDRFGLAWTLARLGRSFVEVDEYDEGETALREGLTLFAAANDMSGVGLLFNSLGTLALRRGNRSRAARLDGARGALEAASGVGIVGRGRLFSGQTEELEKLAETESEAHAEGSAMSMSEAIAFALEEEPHAPLI